MSWTRDPLTNKCVFQFHLVKVQIIEPLIITMEKISHLQVMIACSCRQIKKPRCRSCDLSTISNWTIRYVFISAFSFETFPLISL